MGLCLDLGVKEGEMKMTQFMYNLTIGAKMSSVRNIVVYGS